MGKRHKARKVSDRVAFSGGGLRKATPPGVRPAAWPGWRPFRPLRSWSCPDPRFRLRHS